MSEKRLNQLKKGIGERIQSILDEKDWYQQELVTRTGKNKADISNILQGNKNITLETIAALEDALGEKIIQVTGKSR